MSFKQKANAFDTLNPSTMRSPVLPQQNYFGKEPDPNADDPYLRRKVKQLNDIDLLEDKEPEELANISRLPSKVLTEENLVRILSTDSEKLNLENHYWLSSKFLAKLSTMAPNL